VVGVTLATGEGGWSGAEVVALVGLVAAAVGGVDGAGDEAGVVVAEAGDVAAEDGDVVAQAGGSDVVAGLVSVAVVVAVTNEDGGGDVVAIDGSDAGAGRVTEADGGAGPAGTCGPCSKLGGNVAFGSRVATLVFNSFTWSIKSCLRLASLTVCTVLLMAANLSWA